MQTQERTKSKVNIESSTSDFMAKSVNLTLIRRRGVNFYPNFINQTKRGKNLPQYTSGEKRAKCCFLLY